ncbi:MAG: hypothetical protein JWM11_6609 [Planctomycetaceae bacterium]|nr:hypothetical protein [Planctomycetaceae bacterium]
MLRIGRLDIQIPITILLFVCVWLPGCGGKPPVPASAKVATTGGPASEPVAAVGSDPTGVHPTVEFSQLEADLRRQGFAATLAELARRRPVPDQWIAALNHVRSFLERDPDQLWFQLQARTRLKGWEEFQSQLLKQTPRGTLVALSAGLDSVRPGVLMSWQPNPEPVNLLQLSLDSRLLYCGSGWDLTVLDLSTWEMQRKFEHVGRVAQVLTRTQGDLCLETQLVVSTLVNRNRTGTSAFHRTEGMTCSCFGCPMRVCQTGAQLGRNDVGC